MDRQPTLDRNPQAMVEISLQQKNDLPTHVTHVFDRPSPAALLPKRDHESVDGVPVNPRTARYPPAMLQLQLEQAEDVPAQQLENLSPDAVVGAAILPPRNHESVVGRPTSSRLAPPSMLELYLERFEEPKPELPSELDSELRPYINYEPGAETNTESRTQTGLEHREELQTQPSIRPSLAGDLLRIEQFNNVRVRRSRVVWDRTNSAPPSNRKNETGEKRAEGGRKCCSARNLRTCS